MTASSQVASGVSKSEEIKEQAEYNASIFEQQARMIEGQKGLESTQYDRAIRRTRSTAIARTAKSGLLLSGSPIASIIDAESQMRLDQSIGQYNLEVKKRYAISGAIETRRRGKIGSQTAIQAGYTNAFATLLKTGVSAYAGGTFSGAGKTATVNVMGKVQKVNIAPSNYYQRAGRI